MQSGASLLGTLDSMNSTHEIMRSENLVARRNSAHCAVPLYRLRRVQLATRRPSFGAALCVLKSEM